MEIQPKITQNRLNLAACLIEVKRVWRGRRRRSPASSRSIRGFPARSSISACSTRSRIDREDARSAYAAEVANFPSELQGPVQSRQAARRIGPMAGIDRADARGHSHRARAGRKGYLFAARGLLHESASLDEVQSLAERGLALARTPELKALGWFLMADVFSRRHQPENVDRALRNARIQASARRRAGRPPRRVRD